MLFENYHPFQFDVGPRARETHSGIPDHGSFIDVIDAKTIKLGKLTDTGVKTFTYTYDYGDDWRHTIIIETVALADPAITYPRFMDGVHRAPPEDVGGQPGFEHVPTVMADWDHPEHRDIRRWYGGVFDPNDISTSEIAARMAKLAKRKLPRKTSIAKSKGRIN